MKKLSLMIASCFMAIFIVSNSFAAESPLAEGEWYLAPMGTYVFKEDDGRFTNNGGGLHFGLGRGLSDRWAIEFNLIGNQLSGSQLHDVNQYGFGIDLINTFDVWDNWTPYWLVGTGYLNTEINEVGVRPPVGNDGSNLLGSAGAGLMHEFGDSGSFFRTEVRYRADFADPDTFGDWIFNLGFNMPMGDRAPKVVPVQDADGDGVVDGVDLCPGTPANAVVDANGCELDSDNDGVKNSKDRCPNTKPGADVDSNGCEIVGDADGDGVNDNNDKCPNTPAGSNVDKFGCIVIGDSDGDGILDNVDECPNTAPNVRVDSRGCEIKEEIKLPGVEFEVNSATLTPASLSILQGAVATLNRYPDITVESEGHTDSSGGDDFNMRLSQRRAESVRDYIVGQGIAASRITARGFGETRPIADNSTTEGKQRNRRVTLRLTSQ